MTNYENIKNMNVEELAEFLNGAVDEICFDICTQATGNKYQCFYNEDVTIEKCNTCIKRWLESEKIKQVPNQQ